MKLICWIVGHLKSSPAERQHANNVFWQRGYFCYRCQSYWGWK